MPFVTTLHGTDITLVGQERSFEEITRVVGDRGTLWIDGDTCWIADRRETQERFQAVRFLKAARNYAAAEEAGDPDLMEAFRKEAKKTVFGMNPGSPLDSALFARQAARSNDELLESTNSTSARASPHDSNSCDIGRCQRQTRAVSSR